MIKSIINFISETIWLKDQLLTSKLFTFSAVLVIIPMIAVGVISYYRSSTILEGEARNYSWQINEQVKTQIEYYLRDAEINSLKILNHHDMISFLKRDETGGVKRQELVGAVRDLLETTSYSRPDISSVAVVIDGFGVIDSLGYRGPYPASELEKEYWYASVPANGNSMLVSRIIKWDNYQEPVITIARRIHSPYTLEPIGMLLIDVNFRRLQDIADKVNSVGKSSFYILDAEGHYVYHPDSSKLGRRSEFLNLESILSLQDNSFLSEHDQVVILNHSSSLGWRFVTAIPRAELFRGTAHIGSTIFWTVVITLLIAYVLGVSFASTIIRPIRRLQRFMRNVQVGDFARRLPVESSDEIGQLTNGFNQMVEKLSELMEEVYFSKLRETEMSLGQKEMELKVLQSQINPHFLCNSLETVRGMALEQNMGDIAAMAASLGTLLRYNLTTVSPTVTLREEINFCTVYLKIQQYRFDKNVKYCFDIPQWALSTMIVKFSLQPLVENCFVHSVGDGPEPTRITISACQQADNLIIRVADTGVGMDESVLDKIKHDLINKDITSGGANIGIVNVHRRIVNLFGPDYGVTVESFPGQGTTVLVKLPLIKKEEGGDQHEPYSYCG
ncbi:sensor histidine kinase [Sporomusa malonica]|uniref:histidine kinase n=1 Tax=Sporomusa malonica TaxID=112901 RepID=A0A1W2CNU3_9FIRM|nr:histidine kinase [Sporomusa malonica]SMC86880.1 two-component system, sensor histidine kinase YesM [Sporomusa malonica]